MLSFNSSLKVYVALAPCDMRKSFDGLAAEVRGRLKADPSSGAAFLFGNRNRTLIKILYWDGSGLWVVAKRLEKGTFRWPKPSDATGQTLRLKPEALALLTAGIDLKDGTLRAWYEKPLET